MDHVDEDEIEERDVTAEEEHRDDDDEGGIGQLLVTLHPLLFRVPGPGCFLQLQPDFREEIFCFDLADTSLDVNR